ncbi:MAG TPA: DUF1428 domain-containing protein [Terriglobia bacterium]|nr:DUF1428 domain-containing protein [Terriglobia bacterium]
MRYVDGYVLPIPTKHLAAYRRMALKAAKIWREHGALDYCECAGDDLDVSWGVPFPKLVRKKPDETVIFAWVVFKSRAHRNRVNAAVMKDPRLAAMGNAKTMPFNPERMTYGGFRTIVGKR